MGKMKMEFDLINVGREKLSPFRKIGSVEIIGSSPESSPYLIFRIGDDHVAWMEDEDTERFAINILKALKSKKLKP